MGFAFPKEERAALVAGEPHKFQMPSESDLRFHWVHADLASLEAAEAREPLEVRSRDGRRSSPRTG